LVHLLEAVGPSNAERAADALLAEFQTLARIWTQEPEALARILGPASPAIRLIAGARAAAEEVLCGDLRGCRIDPFAPAFRRYLILSMGSLPDERLRILFLDGSRRLIADEQMQRGTLSQLTLYPRTIFRRALEHNAAGIILVHNHPSGDPSPSIEDVDATRHLEHIGRALEIELIDHIVVTAASAHHIVSSGDKPGAATTPRAFTLRSRDRDPEMHVDLALANAKAAMRRRLLRRQLMPGPELFGDPAWEMLVDLFIHECERKSLSVTSLCVTPSIPLSSALRLCQKMCDAGIMRRIPDPYDGRRNFVRLEPEIAHRLRAYFEAGSD
jgi:DNA repair protein RadC